MRNAIHIAGPIALLILLPMLSACSSCGSFWNRGCVAGARQVAPDCGCPPPQCAPRCTPPPSRCCPPQYRDPCAPPTTARAPQYAPQQQPQYTPRATPAPTYRAPATQVAPNTPVHAPATVQDMAVLDRVNRIRQQHGLRALRFDQNLWVAAKDHSDEQRKHGYMGHGSPDPARRTLAQRMGQAGYGGRVFAEVVAWGYSDTAAVVEGWMNSTDHRRILLDPELTEGAFSRRGEYWTGNLGAPARFRKATPPPAQDYTFRRAPAPQPRASTPQPRYTPAPQPQPQYKPAPQPRRTQPAPQPRRAPARLPFQGFG